MSQNSLIVQTSKATHAPWNLEFMISSRKPLQTLQIYCIRSASRGLKDSESVLLSATSSRSALAHSMEEKLRHFRRQSPREKEALAPVLPSWTSFKEYLSQRQLELKA